MGMDDWLSKYPPKGSDIEKDGAERKSLPVSRKKLIKQPVQRRLDLHGMTAAEAGREVESFLRNSRKQGLRKVLIIHGKGYHSKGKPVLKNEVLRILERSPFAGEFGAADRKDGGSGAVWVLLK